MKRKFLLLIGDSIAILLVVLLGLSFHQSEVATRLQFTFFPFPGSWLLAAWAVRLYGRTLVFSDLWRVPIAAVLAAPLGAVVRAAWLGSAAIPAFVAVMAGVLMIGMFILRMTLLFFATRKAKP